MAQAAVRRSAGQCEAFWAEDFVGDTSITFLSWQAPRLKSLRLISCNVSTAVLNGALAALPMLEDLELSLCSELSDRRTSCGYHNLGKACPRLKRLRLNKHHFRRLSGVRDVDGEALEIAQMRDLRSLQLFGNSLTKVGLAAIIGGCTRLESLDIRHCFNVEVNDETRAMCARLRTLRLPDDSMDGYHLTFGSPALAFAFPEGAGPTWAEIY